MACGRADQGAEYVNLHRSDRACYMGIINTIVFSASNTESS